MYSMSRSPLRVAILFRMREQGLGLLQALADLDGIDNVPIQTLNQYVRLYRWS